MEQFVRRETSVKKEGEYDTLLFLTNIYEQSLRFYLTVFSIRLYVVLHE